MAAIRLESIPPLNPENDTTIRAFAELMCEVYAELTGMEPECRLVEIDGEDFYGPGYEDTTRVIPDIDKLRSLGWEPRRDLRTAVTDAMRYYLDPAHQDPEAVSSTLAPGEDGPLDERSQVG